MVNTRTDADLSAAVQNALQTLLPQICRMHSRLDWLYFKKLFFLQFFPRAEQERLKREYHSIHQTNTETSTEFMQRFLRLAGLPMLLATMRSFMRGMMMTLSDEKKRQKSGDRHQPTSQQSSHRNHGHNNDRHGSDRRGVPVMGVTREIGVSSPTNLPILVLSSPGVPLRATPTRSALRVDADTQESVVELLADKKPGASGRVFAITEDHATKTSDEASDVIISFIKKTQVNLQLQVQRVRTNNGTEFKNKTLAKFFDEIGITQQFSASRTPQQNGVVERRNRTLVEA
nr:integrase, catalytic region, zinc finger, CCHC-type, peptidase aspartic, catalytic [Tanacetum cinerariifolium]